MIYCSVRSRCGTPAVNLGLFFSTGVPVDQLVSERQNTADLLAAALTTSDDDDLQLEQGQSLQSTDALQSLLATAAEGSPEPIISDYDDFVEEQAPLAQIPRRQQQAEAPRGRVPSGRTRRPPGVPRRVRPRPDNDKKGQRQPNNPLQDLELEIA